MKCNDVAYREFSSMGIYLINRDIMVKLLREHFPKANDFASEVVPGAISLGMKVRLILYALPMLLFFPNMKVLFSFSPNVEVLFSFCPFIMMLW